MFCHPVQMEILRKHINVYYPPASDKRSAQDSAAVAAMDQALGQVQVMVSELAQVQVMVRVQAQVLAAEKA
jgi:hypothetical protein